MSYCNIEMLNQVFETKVKLSTKEFALLVVLAKFSNKEGVCWPHPNTICAQSRISRSSFYRVISGLVDRGLVEHAAHDGRKGFRVRLDSPKLGHGLSPDETGCPKLGHGLSPDETGCPKLGQNSPTVGHVIKEEVSTEINKVKYCIINGGKGDPMKVEDVLAQSKKKVYGGKTLAAKLEYLWKQTVPLLFELNSTIPKFTQKEVGLLKHFIAKVGEDHAERVLKEVLNDWSGFCEHVKLTAGVSTCPTMPQIGFILTYGKEAAHFATEHSPIAINCTGDDTQVKVKPTDEAEDVEAFFENWQKKKSGGS